VLLRFAPGTPWPVLAGAVRDEFVDRPWDPPAPHWPHAPGLVGGRDRQAGGTWLAVQPAGPALAALLNGGVLLPPPPTGARPTRGRLPIAALTSGVPADDELRRYDSFHLVRAGLDRVDVWSWNGSELVRRTLEPGDHVIVNDGVDATSDPLVPFIAPVLAKSSTPDPRAGLSTQDAWGDWVSLLSGGDMDPAAPEALIVRRTFADRTYGSTSASLVALGRDGVRYDFTGTPGPRARWREV
jgi:Transport and Golgi organisation 2